jgi:hypothetical protein
MSHRSNAGELVVRQHVLPAFSVNRKNGCTVFQATPPHYAAVMKSLSANQTPASLVFIGARLTPSGRQRLVSVAVPVQPCIPVMVGLPERLRSDASEPEWGCRFELGFFVDVLELRTFAKAPVQYQEDYIQTRIWIPSPCDAFDPPEWKAIDYLCGKADPDSPSRFSFQVKINDAIIGIDGVLGEDNRVILRATKTPVTHTRNSAEETPNTTIGLGTF